MKINVFFLFFGKNFIKGLKTSLTPVLFLKGEDATCIFEILQFIENTYYCDLRSCISVFSLSSGKGIG
jgi:hypothetical protein